MRLAAALALSLFLVTPAFAMPEYSPAKPAPLIDRLMFCDRLDQIRAVVMNVKAANDVMAAAVAAAKVNRKVSARACGVSKLPLAFYIERTLGVATNGRWHYSLQRVRIVGMSYRGDIWPRPRTIAPVQYVATLIGELA